MPAQEHSSTDGGALVRPTMAFMLPHEQFPIPRLVEMGVAAERAGFGAVAASDHLQPWQSNEGHSGLVAVTLTALGQRTERVWMGTTVTCPSFRYNPAVVAQTFASLSLLYPGRLFLGLGSGEALNEEAATGKWPGWTERSERLLEAAAIIRALWTGEQISHQGPYYTVNARLYDPPAAPIPLLLGGNGPKALRRAGTYGDGLITSSGTWRRYRTEFQNAARAAGKDPARMPVLAEQWAIVGGVEDARARAGAVAWRFLPKALSTYVNVRDPAEIQRRAAVEIPLDEVYRDWIVSTDPDAHVKTITELFDSGVTIVNIHGAQPDLLPVVEFYGRQVLPRLRARRGEAGR
jgi:F420-dependent hydroxymycolic acid dehydrogenase